MHQNNSPATNNDRAAMHSTQADSAFHSLGVLDRSTSQVTVLSLHESESGPNNPVIFGASDMEKTEKRHSREEQQPLDLTSTKTSESEETELGLQAHDQSTTLSSLSNSEHGEDSEDTDGCDNTELLNTPERGFPERQDADNSMQKYQAKH